MFVYSVPLETNRINTADVTLALVEFPLPITDGGPGRTRLSYVGVNIRMSKAFSQSKNAILDQ